MENHQPPPAVPDELLQRWVGYHGTVAAHSGTGPYQPMDDPGPGALINEIDESYNTGAPA